MKKNRFRRIIRPIWPVLFWTECYGCKKEFRREWLWITRIKAKGTSIADYECLCRNCASTYFKARKIFTKLYEERSY